MGSTRIDPYFYKQPPLLFVDELRQPLHTSKPEWFGRTVPAQGEISAAGAFLQNEFPDEEGLLDTAAQDFQLFLQVHEIGGAQYPIRHHDYRRSAFTEALRHFASICFRRKDPA